MQIPKKIKIGPHIFDVLFPYQFRETNMLMGQLDTTVNAIRLSAMSQDQAYTASNVWHTLLHEVTHEVLKLVGIEHTETTCDLIAHIILAILIDNGWLEPELPPT